MHLFDLSYQNSLFSYLLSGYLIYTYVINNNILYYKNPNYQGPESEFWQPSVVAQLPADNGSNRSFAFHLFINPLTPKGSPFDEKNRLALDRVKTIKLLLGVKGLIQNSMFSSHAHLYYFLGLLLKEDIIF